VTVFARGARCLVVGHRGGRSVGAGDAWPAENSIEAFERAHREEADAIELDVRACVGGVVVLHDADLARVTGGRDRREVARLTLGEIARVRLASGERVPTLDDVLAWAKGRIALNVEAKHDVPDRASLARAVARALARHAGVDVLLSSFDPVLLAMLAAAAPRTPRAWLTHEGQQRAWAPLAARAPVHAVHVERTMTTPALIARLRARGTHVGAWTVNDAREARDLAALGVDWIITDAPGAIRAALAA
jgi:glycerophosphoryl diester phosphodiesterase